VRVTRFGKPVADIVPPQEKPPQKKRRKSWLGCMRDESEIVGDLMDTRDLWSNGDPKV
jgi:antitoxin (DNA-binding transcriptional repressor) of toxin-antitoxin stability system